MSIRVGFFSVNNYLDKTSFSGALYYMYQALAKQDVTITNLGTPQKPFLGLNIIKKVKKLLKNNIINTSKNLSDDDNYQDFITIVHKQLEKNNCDLIFAPIASKELSFLKSNLPIIFLSDATPELIKNSYQIYKNEKEYSLACETELMAISKAQTLIYTSQWAADSAVSNFNADPNKIKIVCLGANLDFTPPVSQIYEKLNSSKLRLLFIGGNWKRKGGDIVLETFNSLIRFGIDVELVIVGAIPTNAVNDSRIVTIPFLNKNKPSDYKKYVNLFRQSHFLISPTRADCSPLVFSEANAYGVPAITTNIGGIPDLIKEGINGYTLPLSASGDKYAQLILDIFNDQKTYKLLIESSRKEYETRLNWDVWAQQIHSIMAQSIDKVK
ncbi:glycosyltransferase family 4 protein [Geminocystis sp.]|uniref:glycosyltransferase family 4 protein n=1 Tax=Geminocystis sp. TaxID=2664100 RepID=UPI0035940175